MSPGLSVSEVALPAISRSPGADCCALFVRIQRPEEERKHALELFAEAVVEPGIEKDVVARGRHGHSMGEEKQEVLVRPEPVDGRLVFDVVDQIDQVQW